MLSYCYKKYSDNIILHIGTNNKVNKPSSKNLLKILYLENNVVIFNVITPTYNGKLLVKIVMVKN